MTEFLPGFKIERWYQGIAALGAAGFIAALTVKLPGIPNRDALLLCLGMFLTGVGEWVNHPIQTQLMAPSRFAPDGGQLTSYPRFNSPAGVVLDVGGLGLFLFAIYKIAQSA